MADYARGQRLVELRNARHLSQEDAAHEIGTTAKSLRAWEHGATIRWENAKRVAKFYAVDPEELVSREPSVNGSDPAKEETQLDRIEASLLELQSTVSELVKGQAALSSRMASTLARQASAKRRARTAKRPSPKAKKPGAG